MSNTENRMEELENRVGILEDINAIRRLHWAYGYYIDFNRARDVANLFSEDGEVIFLSGIFRGHEGIFRLYGTWFQNYFLEQGGEGPEFGFLLDHFQMQDIITIAPDRKSAKGRFRGLLFGGSHEQRSFRPEGLPLQFMESGIYENDYVRENGVWKIKRLDYMMQWQGDYEDGWSKTVSHLQPLTETYPENPIGPDELLNADELRQTWPHRQDVPMHFAHPKFGAILASQAR
ncbi:MAG: nuclear transport factor 2 family protein [Sphingomonadaceae bacterium]